MKKSADITKSFSASDAGYDMLLGAVMGGLSGSSASIVNENSQGKSIKSDTSKLQRLAETAKNIDTDIEGGKQAKTIADIVSSGGNIANGQAVELQNAVQKQTEKDYNTFKTAMTSVNRVIEERGLNEPYTYTRNNDGTVSRTSSEFVHKQAEANAELASTVVNNVIKDNKDYQIDDTDTAELKSVLTQIESGELDDISSLRMFGADNTVARTALEEMTGTKLPKSNSETVDAIVEYVGQKRIDLAEAQRTNVVDRLKGMATQEANNAYGVNTIKEFQNITDAMGNDIHTQDARDMMRTFSNYAAGAKAGIDFETIENSNNDAHNILTKEQRKAIYDASVADNEPEAVLTGVTVDQGDEISKLAEKAKKEGKTVTGKVYTNELSDSKRVHLDVKQMNALNTLASNLNLDIHVVDSEWMLGSEYTTKEQKEMKEAPNGFEINGAIYWNVDSDKPMMYVVGHEILHHLKTYAPNEYKELRDTLLTACIDRGRLQLGVEITTMQALYKQHGAELSREKAIEEIIANQMYGLTESETFWNALEDEKPSLARRILDAIRDILHKIRTTLMGEESFDENISNYMYESLGILTDMEELTAKALIKAKTNRLAVGEVSENGVNYVLKGYDIDDIEIYETSKETMGKTWNERKQRAKEIITKEYKGKTAKFKDKNGNVTYARFDKVTAKKNIYGDKNSSKAGKDAKVNAIADGDFINLIENSEADRVGVPDNPKHPHKNVNSWSYYIKTVAIDGIYYDETINIKNRIDGEYVYEVSFEENANKKGIVPLITRQYSISPASSLEATIPSIDNSISSDANVINDNINTLQEAAEQISIESKPDVSFNISTENIPMAKATNFFGDKGRGIYADRKHNPILKSGRELRQELMRQNEFVEDQIQNLDTFFDNMNEFITGEDGLAYRYKYIGFEDLHDTKIEIRYKNGKPHSIIMSAMVKNSEYPVNFDFTTICKKRERMMDVINELAGVKTDKGDSVLDSISLTAENMWKINSALKEEGLETACLGCFVESLRYNSANFFTKVDTVWNSRVREVRKKLGLPEEEYFDFGDTNESNSDKISNSDMEKAINHWDTYDKEPSATKGGRPKNSPANRMNLLFENILKDKDVDSPYLKLVKPSDILTPQGVAGIKSLSSKKHDLMTTFKGFYGQSAPKEIMAFTPYNSEIAMLPRKKGRQLMENYLKGIGGVRMNSFSDFKVENFFDYMQMIADMSARGFVAHAYTKEIDFARIFGKTGIKINLSLMFDVDRELCSKYGKQYAGLSFIDKDNLDTDIYSTVAGTKGKRYAKEHTLPDGREGYLVYLVGDKKNSDNTYAREYEKHIADGKTEDEARELANKSRPFTQSIDFDDAVALQSQDGYKENVGTIAVAIGELHMEMLAEDPDIRYIIPYHRSNLSAYITAQSNLDMAKDHTDTQGTMKLDHYKGANGAKAITKDELKKRLKELKESNVEFPCRELLKELNERITKENLTLVKNGKNLEGTGKFDVYKSLHKHKNPQKVAEEYMEYCINNGLIPIFPEYATMEGYYKTLFDYSVTDGSDVFEQRSVTNTYPGIDGTSIDVTEDNANLDELKRLIDDASNRQNEVNIEGKRAMGSVMDKLLGDNPSTSVLEGTNIQALKYGEEDSFKTPVQYQIDSEEKVIPDYDEETYNRYGWAYVHEKLADVDYAVFFNQISALARGCHYNVREGLYIIPTGANQLQNVLIYTDGDYENPSINKVIKISSQNATDIEIVKKGIYDAEEKSVVEFVDNCEAEGLLNIYTKRDVSYAEWKRKRENQTNRTNATDSRREQDGRGGNGENQAIATDGNQVNNPKINYSITPSDDGIRKLTNDDIPKLQDALGAKRWQKNDKDRLYIDIQSLRQYSEDNNVGWFHPSRNIQKFGKVWIDNATGELHTNNLTKDNEKEVETIIADIIGENTNEEPVKTDNSPIISDDVLDTMETNGDFEDGSYVPIDDPLVMEGRARSEDTIRELQNQIEELKEKTAKQNLEIEKLKTARKFDKKLTHGKVLKEKSVKPQINDLVKTIMNSYKHEDKTNNQIVNGILENSKEIFSLIQEDNLDDAVMTAFYTAEEVVDGLVLNDDGFFNQYKDLKEELRTTRIEVPEYVRNDMGDYSDFRKSNAGRLRLVSEEIGGRPIDTYYQELLELYPDLFTEDITNEVDQLQKLSEVAESIRVYELALTSEESTALAQQIGNDLMDIIYDNGESKTSFADRKKQQYNDMVAKMRVRKKEAVNKVRESEREKAKKQKQNIRAKEKEKRDALRERKDEEIKNVRTQKDEKIAEIREDRDKKIRDLKEDKKESLKKLRSNKNEEMDKKLSEQKQKYKDKEQKRRESARRRELHKKINKNVKWLADRALKPSKEKPCPEILRKPIGNLIASLDTQTKVSKDRAERIAEKNDEPIRIPKAVQKFSELKLNDAPILVGYST